MMLSPLRYADIDADDAFELHAVLIIFTLFYAYLLLMLLSLPVAVFTLHILFIFLFLCCCYFCHFDLSDAAFIYFDAFIDTPLPPLTPCLLLRCFCRRLITLYADAYTPLCAADADC